MPSGHIPPIEVASERPSWPGEKQTILCSVPPALGPQPQGSVYTFHSHLPCCMHVVFCSQSVALSRCPLPCLPVQGCWADDSRGLLTCQRSQVGFVEAGGGIGALTQWTISSTI